MNYTAWRISYQDSEQATRAAYKRAIELENRLFALGAMEDSPCFCCGYNGPGYYQPAQHACAARHHKLRHNKELNGAPEE